MLAQKLQLLQGKIKAGGEEAPAVAAEPAVGVVAAVPSGDFKAIAVFETMKKQLSSDIVSKVKAVFRFDITSGSGSKCSWLVDLNSGSGSVAVSAETAKADCSIAIKDEDFVSLMSGKLNPQQAFMKGLIKVKGNMMLAQKLQLLQTKQAKL